jgi:hypothetical protein
VKGLRTSWGLLDLAVAREGADVRFRIGGTAKPPGGFVAEWPLDGRPSDILVDGRPVARMLPGRVTVASAPAEILMRGPRT